MFYSYEILPTGTRQTEVILEDSYDILAVSYGLELLGDKATSLRERLSEQKSTAMLPEYDARRTSPYFIDSEAELIIEGLVKTTGPSTEKKRRPYINSDRSAIARDILVRAGIFESQIRAEAIPVQGFRGHIKSLLRSQAS